MFHSWYKDFLLKWNGLYIVDACTLTLTVPRLTSRSKKHFRMTTTLFQIDSYSERVPWSFQSVSLMDYYKPWTTGHIDFAFFPDMHSLLLDFVWRKLNSRSCDKIVGSWRLCFVPDSLHMGWICQPWTNWQSSEICTTCTVDVNVRI